MVTERRLVSQSLVRPACRKTRAVEVHGGCSRHAKHVAGCFSTETVDNNTTSCLCNLRDGLELPPLHVLQLFQDVQNAPDVELPEAQGASGFANAHGGAKFPGIRHQAFNILHLRAVGLACQARQVRLLQQLDAL